LVTDVRGVVDRPDDSGGRTCCDGDGRAAGGGSLEDVDMVDVGVFAAWEVWRIEVVCGARTEWRGGNDRDHRSRGGTDADFAEEVAQDAFHAVWRRASSYRPERGAVRTWLLAICRNAAIDWRRTRGKRSEREVSIDTAADLIADGRVDERVVDALREERVRKAVSELPAEQRDVLSLAFWGGYSQTEIAARTNTPLGTVKSRVRLGMTKLRERLVDER